MTPYSGVPAGHLEEERAMNLSHSDSIAIAECLKKLPLVNCTMKGVE